MPIICIQWSNNLKFLTRTFDWAAVIYFDKLKHCEETFRKIFFVRGIKHQLYKLLIYKKVHTEQGVW